MHNKERRERERVEEPDADISMILKEER